MRLLPGDKDSDRLEGADSMLNHTALQGRLVRDPELRHTQAGTPVASFTVAWSEKYGEKETQCFLPCTAWRSTGEFVEKYFRKGQEIAVEGKLITRKWVDNDGQNRSTTQLNVDKVHFCGPKQDGDSSNTFRPAGAPVAVSSPGFSELGDDDGELPF